MAIGGHRVRFGELAENSLDAIHRFFFLLFRSKVQTLKSKAPLTAWR